LHSFFVVVLVLVLRPRHGIFDYEDEDDDEEDGVAAWVRLKRQWLRFWISLDRL
jgi:hypothetical protein